MSSTEDMVPVEELNKLQSDFDALEKEHTELKASNETLTTEHEAVKTERDELKEKFKDVDLDEVQGVRDRLAAFEKSVKDQAIKVILAKAKEDAWKEDELKEMDVDQLKLILKAVDSAKGSATYKGVRPAGAGDDDKEGKLTAGDLFHVPMATPVVKPGGAS